MAGLRPVPSGPITCLWDTSHPSENEAGAQTFHTLPDKAKNSSRKKCVLYFTMDENLFWIKTFVRLQSGCRMLILETVFIVELQCI